jgi:hypothetical protein
MYSPPYSLFILLTHPPTPSLKGKGRGDKLLSDNDITLPLLLKGRVGKGLRKRKRDENGLRKSRGLGGEYMLTKATDFI